MGISSTSSAVRSGKVTVPSLGVAACAWAWVDATLRVIGNNHPKRKERQSYFCHLD